LAVKETVRVEKEKLEMLVGNTQNVSSNSNALDYKKNNFGLDNSLTSDDCFNTLASEYIAEHYQFLVDVARRMDIRADLAEDLLSEVFISIASGEKRGKGYSMSYESQNKTIPVEGFVLGRMRRYAKNRKFRRQGSDSIEISESSLVMGGASNGDDEESTKGARALYTNAPSYESMMEMGTAELAADIENLIATCQDFEFGEFNIINILKCVGSLAISDIDDSLFEGLRRRASQHSDLAEAIEGVLQYRAVNPIEFEAALRKFEMARA
jgi:hypothetical protein